MRKIIIYEQPDKLLQIRDLINKYKDEITKRNIEVEYKIGNSFSAELYGYDGYKKMTIKNMLEIPNLIEEVDKMPMGKIEKAARESFSNRNELLEKCNLPNISSTSHCFNDDTHHTCCMLGPKARKYANNSGNPIGITSENAFYNRYKVNPTQEEMTSWCTCTGSKVCTYYASKFNDGTHIKFIGKTNTKNEDEAISQMGIARHSTPGVQ